LADLTDFDTPSFLLMEDAGFTLMEDWQPGWYVSGSGLLSGIKTIIGLNVANVKTIHGLAFSSMKTWDGLA
jgi:hypothetical protein